MQFLLIFVSFVVISNANFLDPNYYNQINQDFLQSGLVLTPDNDTETASEIPQKVGDEEEIFSDQELEEGVSTEGVCTSVKCPSLQFKDWVATSKFTRGQSSSIFEPDAVSVRDVLHLRRSNNNNGLAQGFLTCRRRRNINCQPLPEFARTWKGTVTY